MLKLIFWHFPWSVCLINLEIDNILNNVERSRDVFKTRMKTVDESFKINYAFYGQSSNPTYTCTFQILKKFGYQSILSLCQLHLIAYRVGKLTQREDQFLSTKKAAQNKARYFMNLKGIYHELCIQSFLLIYFFL